jgi:hypothetical protein
MRSTLTRLAPGLALGLALALVASGEPPRAEDYNQRPFLAPGQMSKVQRVVAGGRAMQGNQAGVDGDSLISPNQSIVNTGCGELSVGNVRTTGRAGERAPRDNVVVAREIINAPINCGTRGRR